MIKNLDFLVIGAQKCATSWLYLCLKEHPELHLPAKKNENEYLGGDVYEARGIEWFFSRFAGAQGVQKIGDVSVEYLCDPRSPNLIHHYTPNLKIVVSLRDPIDRAISAYYWRVRRGRIPNLPLEEGLRIAADENQPCQNAQMRGFYNDLIRRGFYDIQLEHYLKYFNIDQFLFILYEDIKDKPHLALSKVYEFLEVCPSFKAKSLNVRPKVNTYIKPLIYLENMVPNARPLRKAMDLMHRLMHRLGVSLQKPTVSEELLQQLRVMYQPHVAKLQDIMQRAPKTQQPCSFDLAKVWAKVRS